MKYFRAAHELAQPWGKRNGVRSIRNELRSMRNGVRSMRNELRSMRNEVWNMRNGVRSMRSPWNLDELFNFLKKIFACCINEDLTLS